MGAGMQQDRCFLGGTTRFNRRRPRAVVFKIDPIRRSVAIVGYFPSPGCMRGKSGLQPVVTKRA
jgi:hypothetical protein